MCVYEYIKVIIMSRHTIGQQLKAERKARSLTQSDIAAKLQCGRARISTIETGRYQGSLQLLERYLNLMKLELIASSIENRRPSLNELEAIYED